jgi:predicted RNA-binding protein associated with RNAse of E/G family
MRVIERKTRLDGSAVEFECEGLHVEPGSRAVLRYVIDREWHVGGVTVAPGMVTIAHYWMDRPYNVYHWLSGRQTVGYYCSVAEPTEITAELVAYLDLAVDVLLRASGASEVMDEDEVPPDLEPRHRIAIARATEAIVTNPRRLIAEIESESRRYL